MSMIGIWGLRHNGLTFFRQKAGQLSLRGSEARNQEEFGAEYVRGFLTELAHELRCGQNLQPSPGCDKEADGKV